MEYKGWTLYDEVALVIEKSCNGKYSLPQAYVVDSKNKKQLETAINWGKNTEYLKDEKGDYLRDEEGKPVIKEVSPEVIN